MSFRSLQEEAGFESPKKTHDGYGGYIYSTFFRCIVEKALRSSLTLPSVFLPDNTELHPPKMKLHPSLLSNKYAH
jgi:hypothetical protein